MSFCRLLFTWASFTDEEQVAICTHACPLGIPEPLQCTSPCAFPWPFPKLACTRFGDGAQDLCSLQASQEKPGDTPLRASGSLALTSSRPNAPPSRSESRGRAQAKSRCRPFPHPTAQPTAGPARINPPIFPVLPLLHRGSALLSGFPSNSLRNPFTYQRLPCTLLISSPLRPSLLPTPED